MNKRIWALLTAPALLIGILGFVAADDPIGRIRQQMEKWASAHPVEKVYLHMDKPYYAAGDDIWLKAYVVAGPEHRLSTLSGVVNVDLLDSRNDVKQTIKLQLSNGTAAGDFALPDTLSAGNYHIRAYTNYMRNAGPEYFFDQAVTILGGMASKLAPVKPAGVAGNSVISQDKPDVQFFPEGGYLVNGLTSQVAFKAIGPDGLASDVKGVVTDANGREVVNFSSAHLGMGKFSFTPMAGNTYTARITTNEGAVLTIALPKAQDKGYVMTITDQGTDLQLNVSASKSLLNDASAGALTLVGQSGGAIYFTNTGKPGSAAFTSRVAKNKFPTGIAQFTLFTAAGEPLAERLVFIRNADKLVLSVNGPQAAAPRQKVKLDLSANAEGSAAAGNFSVAVIDESRVPVNEDRENNILASLLLSSDLKGYIEQPAYYFNHNSAKTAAELDVLMLTQGYRRFNWAEVLNDRNRADSYTLEKSLRISGTVTSPDGKPVAGGKVNLLDIDNIEYTMDTLTNARGRFSFDNLAFNDSIRLIVQARTAKNKKDVVITLDSIAPPATTGSRVSPDLSVDIRDSISVYDRSSRALYALQRQYGVGNHVIPLREVIIREKKKALKYSANLNGPGNADQVLLAKDLQFMGCVNITDCLQGRLLGVIFRNGIPYSTRSYRPMQVIVDGIYVEGSYLNNLNYNDVQAIEVLRNIGLAAIYGSRGGSGVIIVTTKRGDEPDIYAGPIRGRGIKFTMPKGYLNARTFYSPAYDAPKVTKQLADLRTTVYWNPNVTTGADGKTSVEYFNAGGKGTYRVVVEGIDNNGNIARTTYRYTLN